jgi:hypothetical protein
MEAISVITSVACHRQLNDFVSAQMRQGRMAWAMVGLVYDGLPIPTNGIGWPEVQARSGTQPDWPPVLSHNRCAHLNFD